MWHVENMINWLEESNNAGTRYEGRQWITTFYNVSAMYVTIPPRLRSGIDQLGETKELCWRWLHLSQHSHLPLETVNCAVFHGPCVLHHYAISTAANLASIISLLRLKSCNCICHNIYSSHPGSQNTSTVGDLLSSSRSPAAEHNRWTVKTLRMGEVRVGAFIPLYQHKYFFYSLFLAARRGGEKLKFLLWSLICHKVGTLLIPDPLSKSETNRTSSAADSGNENNLMLSTAGLNFLWLILFKYHICVIYFIIKLTAIDWYWYWVSIIDLFMLTLFGHFCWSTFLAD